MRRNLATRTPGRRSPFESKGIEPVTPEEAHGQPEHLFRLWMAANANVATLGTGALATALLGLPLWKAVIAIAVANLAGSLALGLFSTYGVRYGVPMMALGERWFGRTGNRILCGINFLNGAAWFAVNTAVAAYALEHVLSVPPVPMILLLAAAQILVAIIGHKGILRAGDICFLLLVFLFSVVSVLALLPLPSGIAPARSGEATAVPGAMVLAGTIALSYLAGWMVFAADYSRYLRYDGELPSIEQQVFRQTFWGAFLSTTWLEILGAFLGETIRSDNPTELLFPLLPGSLHLLLAVAIVVGTISANVINLYSAGLSLLGAGLRIPQYQAALLVGTAGLAAALLGYSEFYRRYEGLLFFLAYLIFPRLPVLAIAHFRPRVSRIPTLETGSIGFFSWLGGVLLSLPFVRQESWFVGPFAAAHPEWGDLAFAVGAVGSALLYLGFTRARTAALTAPGGPVIERP